MKRTFLLFVLTSILSLNLFAVEPTLLVSEDFSSAAWDAEFLRIDPTYVKPAAGGIKAIITTAAYFDKYTFGGGAIQTIAVDGTNNFTLECPLYATQSIVHNDGSNQAISFRFRNSGISFMEFPKLPSAGIITLHVKNGNADTGTTLTLQQDVSGTWTDIHTFDLQPSANYRNSYLDEVVTYSINSSDSIKLRINRGTKFVNMFRVDIASYTTPTGLNHADYPGFKLVGRTLFTDKPAQVVVYNLQGKSVFTGFAEQSIELPDFISKGLYIVKGGNGYKKIVL